MTSLRKSPKQSPVPRTVARPVDSRELLLSTAEQLVVQHGLSALRTRDLVAKAGVNISLITYYFGGIEGLIAQLLELNVARVLDRQRQMIADLPDSPPSLKAISRALMGPLLEEAAFVPKARAAFVVQEILTHVSSRAARSAETRSRRLCTFASAPRSRLPALDGAGGHMALLLRLRRWNQHEPARARLAALPRHEPRSADRQSPGPGGNDCRGCWRSGGTGGHG